VRGLSTDLKLDAMLHYFETFLREDLSGCGGAGFKQEAQTEEPNATPVSEFGTSLAGELPEGTPVVGSSSADLDSINELIQTDHLYYKEVEELKTSSHNEAGLMAIPIDSNNNVVIGELRSAGGDIICPATLNAEGLGAEFTLPTGQVVVITSSAPPSSTVTDTTRWSTPSQASTTTITTPSSNKAALTMMVDPNEVYTPRSVLTQNNAVATGPTAATTHEAKDDDLLDMNLDLAALDYESFVNFDSLEQGFSTLPPTSNEEQQNHQSMITGTIPPLVKADFSDVTNCNGRQRKLSSVSSVSPPPVHVPDMSHVINNRLDFNTSCVSDKDCATSSYDSGFSSGGSVGSVSPVPTSPVPTSPVNSSSTIDTDWFIDAHVPTSPVNSSSTIDTDWFIDDFQPQNFLPCLNCF